MYSSSNITAITDVPALVSTFAATAGWTVTGAAGSPILTHPTLPGAISFQLTAAVVGNDHTLTWTASGAPVVTSNALITSPKMNGTLAAPDVSLPSKVHLFGDLLPEPFLAIVVEYGFNLYRHLYFGYVEKLSAFTGGECIAGSGFGDRSDLQPQYRGGFTYYLFDALQAGRAAATAGGVRVDHASNATKWRRFATPTSVQAALTMTTDTALGGFQDDINSGYLARGKSTYAGTNILVPMTLYAVKQGGNPPILAPIGAPAGVRMIHIQDIDPGAEFIVGTKTWKAFAAFRKNASTFSTVKPAGWNTDETSLWVGYAYPKD